jgi:hypothetical protein
MRTNEIDILKERLRISTQALDDWTTLAAPEYCNIDRVNEANKRVFSDGGGLLNYIATIVSENHKLLRG